jgi:hypothetical protein
VTVVPLTLMTCDLRPALTFWTTGAAAGGGEVMCRSARSACRSGAVPGSSSRASRRRVTHPRACASCALARSGPLLAASSARVASICRSWPMTATKRRFAASHESVAIADTRASDATRAKLSKSSLIAPSPLALRWLTR